MSPSRSFVYYSTDEGGQRTRWGKSRLVNMRGYPCRSVVVMAQLRDDGVRERELPSQDDE